MRIAEDIRKDDFLRTSILIFGITLLGVGILRLGIYQWLRTHGYFYGIPWDSFSRALISFTWSRDPFFSLLDGYWLPLQFYLVGSVFALIRTWLPTSEILVPVIINNIFFVGSIIVLYLLTLKISQKPVVAGTACILASVFAGDVFVTYTALSEPMLIFFMLLASYLFYDMHTGGLEAHPRKAVITAFVVLLAAASHYIGWFIAVFFCLYFGYYFALRLIGKNYLSAGYYSLAIAVCVVAPIAWLLNNYLLFGDPFYPLQAARQAQAAYIGQMGVIKRVLVTPWVIFKDFYPITIPGIAAGLFLLLKDRRTFVYLVPIGSVLGWIWLSTALAFSAPYQEPRYLVFIGWALCPIIAIGGYYLLTGMGASGKALALIIFLAIVLLNLHQIGSFRNSFDETVRAAGMQARHWLETKPESARIILNQDSFAETGVIPLISGYPGRIILVSNDEMEAAYSDPKGYLNAKADPWLCITKDKAFAEEARSRDMFVRRTGKYFLISEQPF